jgi:hypothetical protein
MQSGSSSSVAQLCDVIERACNTEEHAIPCCICFKLPGDPDLHLTAVLDERASTFIRALVEYFESFSGCYLSEYDEAVLSVASMERPEIIYIADTESFLTAKRACEQLYRDDTLEYVIIFLECPPDYQTQLGDEAYISHIFMETVSASQRTAYPIMTQAVKTIRKRLGLNL